MGDSRPSHPTRQIRRPSAQVADARGSKRPLLPPEKQLPVAHASTRVPFMVHGTPLLQTMASGRHLGEDQRGFAREGPPTRRSQSPTECRDPPYPVGKVYERRWRTRIRWGEEVERQEAPSSGGYAGDGAKSQGALGGSARSCGG